MIAVGLWEFPSFITALVKAVECNKDVGFVDRICKYMRAFVPIEIYESLRLRKIWRDRLRKTFLQKISGKTCFIILNFTYKIIRLMYYFYLF